MKIEKYNQQVVPENSRKDSAYRINPVNLSAGLAVDADGMLARSAAVLGRNLNDAWKIIDDTNEKVQREKDELFGNGLFHEFSAEMRNFQPTLNAEEDNQKLELIRQNYAKRLEDEKTISEEFRAKAQRTYENNWAVYGIQINGARQKMAFNQNVAQNKSFMDEAVSSGNIEDALKWRTELVNKGIPVAPEESIKSVCTLNGLIGELVNAENITMLDDLEKVKAGLSKKNGYLGMNLPDTQRYLVKLKAAQRQKAIDDDEQWLARFADGNIQTEDMLKAEFDYGLLDASTYNKRGRLLKAWNTEQARDIKHSETQAEKEHERILRDEKAKFLIDLKLMEPSGSAEDTNKQFDAKWAEAQNKFKDSPMIQNEILSALKTQLKEGNVWSSDDGKVCKAYASEAYKKGKLYSDPWGLFNKQKGPDFQAARYLEVLGWMESELKKKTPVDVILKGTDEKMRKLNSGTVQAFLTQSMVGTVKQNMGKMQQGGEIIEGGYRFKGGDKAKKENWEKIK